VSFQPSPIRKPLEGSTGRGLWEQKRHGGKVNILNQFKETRGNSAILWGTLTKNIKEQILIDEGALLDDIISKCNFKSYSVKSRSFFAPQPHGNTCYAG